MNNDLVSRLLSDAVEDSAALRREAAEALQQMAARFTRLDAPRYSNDPMLDAVLAVPSERFRARVQALPATYWARYDLSAVRIGYELGLAEVALGEALPMQKLIGAGRA
ncbi:hypothetical protein E4T66_18490 [Sinimarinibacterium sp. CAU 1509]|uniref:hypothetical protein n=1 Tax=Sinimarinibacterium sp. CAU 1509 TaxID=2562283 RepID=UPI0010AC8DB0|nr:hypothetical protein [Sinimarinibacterium sp. CAU 1509]TJY57396.1 hypothetical protein E4T66_18490 [Sinimarinibacterium sp. CAU 1509]